MISPRFFQEDFISVFSEAFHHRKPLPETFTTTSQTNLLTEVFPVAVWHDFLLSDSATSLKTELAQMPFKLRSSDLYEFDQTIDLKHAPIQQFPTIRRLCDELYSPEFLAVMERITGRSLGPHVDISGQRYSKGHFLLCHDDRLESRRIALILYLVGDENDQEPWDSRIDGGNLMAMRCDEEGRPVASGQKLCPAWNTLGFFEVSRFSFHQVQQVLSDRKARFSVTCWFHDPQDSESKESTTINELPLVDLDLKSDLNASDSLVAQMINDICEKGRSICTQTSTCQILSLLDYPIEPSWMKFFLSPSLLHSLHSKLPNLTLDWPTRPVLRRFHQRLDHFIASSTDSQAEVEYNYKERTVIRSNDTTIHLTVILRNENYSDLPAAGTVRLSTRPLEVLPLNRPDSDLIVLTMKFTFKPKHQ